MSEKDVVLVNGMIIKTAQNWVFSTGRLDLPFLEQISKTLKANEASSRMSFNEWSGNHFIKASHLNDFSFFN